MDVLRPQLQRSEPGERVLTEVSSGECYPGAIRYIGPAQREALAAPLRAKGLPEGLLVVAVIESAATNMSETDGRPLLLSSSP